MFFLIHSQCIKVFDIGDRLSLGFRSLELELGFWVLDVGFRVLGLEFF